MGAACCCVVGAAVTHAVQAPPADGRAPTLPVIYWGWYDPCDAIASRVHAQADLLRAHGDVAVDFAKAREIQADAVKKEIANSVERVQAYWDRRSIWEAEMLKQRGTFLNDKKKHNNATWDRLKNHPECNGPGIGSGRMLNFLLDRLSGTVLAYEYSQTAPNRNDPLVMKLALPKDVLAGLSLRQVGADGPGLVFRADRGTALDLDWWPFALKGEEFRLFRRAFEQARESLVQEARTNRSLSVDGLRRLDQTLSELGAEFNRRYTKDRRLRDGMKSYREYRTAESFLRSLDGEIGRLQTTGSADALIGRLGFSPEKDGQDLMALLTYMARNGVEFAPAVPGHEPSYHIVFAMMRDLYTTVADDDPAIRPRETSSQKKGPS